VHWEEIIREWVKPWVTSPPARGREGPGERERGKEERDRRAAEVARPARKTRLRAPARRRGGEGRNHT